MVRRLLMTRGVTCDEHFVTISAVPAADEGSSAQGTKIRWASRQRVNWSIGHARAALHETITAWKAKNAITGTVRETPEKPEPHPYWRSAVSPDLFLTPDVVTTSDYTICWKGVISKAVCTSGTKLCW
jgi:hypothetical protein